MNTHFFVFLIFSSLIFPTISFSQTQFPDTEIYMADVHIVNDVPKIFNEANITNRKGYDNQPCFSADGKSILFSSIHEDGQSDIYRYNLLNKITSQVTKTPESEYSPTITPDQKHFSSVRVEMDSTQRLWQFSLEGSNPEVLFPNVDSVGYHCWIGKDSIAFFILNEPFSLQLIYSGEEPRIIASKIGRCIKKIPGESAISFVVKEDSVHWAIQRFNYKTNQITTIINTLPDSEDFAWMNNGDLIMANGNELFYSSPKKNKTWKSFAKFSFGKIGRLTLNPAQTKICMVITLSQ